MSQLLSSLSYCNPVWPDYFADPFVFRARGEYWAYGTEARVPHENPQQRVFGVLHSPDLVNWTLCEGALQQIKKPLGWSYWAPEVVEHEGSYVMFYSSSGRTFRGLQNHHLRVALADHPAGPFQDQNVRLFPEESFSIDAHPFRDPRDGRYYLFFARHDLTYERQGAGIAVAPLSDDLLSFAERPVWALRPHAEWHIWGRERELFGKVYEAWHTIEGPFVVFRDGLYWMFYSGGSWETPNYGVSYAIAEHPLGPWRDEWSSQGPQVLKGVAPHAVGPGHNSIVKAPDGETDIMCYHAWDAAQTARRLCIDPIEWTPNGPRVLGPTWTPQAGEWLIGHRE